MNAPNSRLTADVCIMGAGPVGGSLACRLAEAGIATVVVDRAALAPMEHPAFDGRAYAISAGSRRLLDEAGLWAKLPEPAQDIREIRVSDGRVGRPASRLHLHFDCKELGDDSGAFGWMVEARGLRVALNRHMPSLPALRVLAPAEARVERRADGATVHIAGGPRIECRLVVAAEGRNSPLREQAGIPVTRLPYGQTGMTFAIAHEQPHHGIAVEHFLPAGPFALLPMAPSADALADGAPNVSAIVWSGRPRGVWATISARFGWWGGGGAIRSRPCSRIGIWIPGWRWRGTPRTASIRLRARASIWGSATRSCWGIY